MKNSKLPTEVELIYEVMPCSAMRAAQEPTQKKHSCNYFRRWGAYHSYDYNLNGPPAEPGISHPSKYVGLANLTPEVLSGCRKAPIFVVGINPNLTGYSASRKNSVYPLFDEYKQFAHYFRYRSTEKLEIPKDQFNTFDLNIGEVPPLLVSDLDVPEIDGIRTIPLQMQLVSYYNELQKLLDDLGEEMNWVDHELKVGEDVAYGNMVACPSARWLTGPTNGFPNELIMSGTEVKEIVQECFHNRKYFLRQLFQSLPRVIMVVGSTTAKPFITALKDRFIEGNPKTSEGLSELIKRKHILQYGELADGTLLTARVIFSGHITGDPATYAQYRDKVLEQMVEEAQVGNLVYNVNTRHLARPKGGCVFCPMLEIGNCDYSSELSPLSEHPALTADSPSIHIVDEKKAQYALMESEPVRESAESTLWQEDASDFVDN
jgi:hypothetical protein